jgi:hypothetical protein
MICNSKFDEVVIIVRLAKGILVLGNSLKSHCFSLLLLTVHSLLLTH